jgi:dephospho-CoA kinase
VARLFEKWGAAVVDADALARVAVEPGAPGLAALVNRFGEEILDEDGRLDREKLGTIIFTDKASRAFVESTLHPIIRQMWLERLQLLKRNQMIDLIVYVVPLFFESKNSYPEIKKVILVTAPEEVRLARVVERDVLSREAALARIRAQLPESEKIKKSDYVIPNDESLTALEARTRLLFAEIARKA